MSKILKQLKKMPRRELAKMASEFEPPLDVKKHWNADKIAKKIRERQIGDEANKPEVEPVNQGLPDPPENPKLEAALTEEEPEPAEKRGGVRENAGRPPGSTEELCERKRALQIQQADPNVRAAIQLVNDLAAGKDLKEHPELSLSDIEADLFGLPVTRVVEYHFPGALNNIFVAYVEMILGGYMLIKVIREKRQAAGIKPVEAEVNADD